MIADSESVDGGSIPPRRNCFALLVIVFLRSVSVGSGGGVGKVGGVVNHFTL